MIAVVGVATVEAVVLWVAVVVVETCSADSVLVIRVPQ